MRVQIDIQKAYDTVSWAFLEKILFQFGFHRKMVKWIMACVSTATYSLSINGNLHGFFKGRRGLRQGDPMSPYLFTLVMEVLTLLLQNLLGLSAFSVSKIKVALEQFSSISGLVPSSAKSTVFFCNVPLQVKQDILNIMPFQQGSLPVRYLGVPLITSRLTAGALQGRVVSDLEKRMRRFLWNAGNVGTVKAKVAWNDICLPKSEGGLGIRRVVDPFLQLHDRLVWKDLEGNIRHYSSLEVWHTIRLRKETTNWSGMHDRDSRDHLFFLCNFAVQVWNNIKTMVDMDIGNLSWSSVTDWMNQYSDSRKLEHVVGKLCLLRRPTSYGRNFKGQPDHKKVMETWQIPSRALDEDPG
ncbi:uncharacterized protein LOC118488237 [Helianthus annuus]|uniref:uncharacterized protein LOC118488237 n=1 Tax=Helianthus annuus TaxID=4232 RepID=UPI0016530776|nr:uncharacterized protein LOC118488237 [Helianthus annuus]